MAASDLINPRLHNEGTLAQFAGLFPSTRLKQNYRVIWEYCADSTQLLKREDFDPGRIAGDEILSIQLDTDDYLVQQKVDLTALETAIEAFRQESPDLLTLFDRFAQPLFEHLAQKGYDPWALTM